MWSFFTEQLMFCSLTHFLQSDQLIFLQCDPFSTMWPILYSVTRFSKCDLLFTGPPIFYSVTYFFAPTKG